MSIAFVSFLLTSQVAPKFYLRNSLVLVFGTFFVIDERFLKFQILHFHYSFHILCLNCCVFLVSERKFYIVCKLFFQQGFVHVYLVLHVFENVFLCFKRTNLTFTFAENTFLRRGFVDFKWSIKYLYRIPISQVSNLILIIMPVLRRSFIDFKCSFYFFVTTNFQISQDSNDDSIYYRKFFSQKCCFRSHDVFQL